MATASRSSLGLVLVLVALLALTALSVGLHFAHAGPVIALAIAAVKVALVAMVFMELRDSGPVVRIAILVAIAFVALLLIGIAGDVEYR